MVVLSNSARFFKKQKPYRIEFRIAMKKNGWRYEGEGVRENSRRVEEEF